MLRKRVERIKSCIRRCVKKRRVYYSILMIMVVYFVYCIYKEYYILTLPAGIYLFHILTNIMFDGKIIKEEEKEIDHETK